MIGIDKIRRDCLSQVVWLATLVLYVGCGQEPDTARPKPPSVVTKEDAREAASYFKRGSELYDKKDYEGAIELFTKAIDRNPNDAQTHLDRGIAYYVIGHNRRAIEDFTKAAELDPSASYAFLNRAAIWRELNQNDKALADYSACIKIGLRAKKQPANLKNAYNYRGAVWADEKRFDKAIADYNEAIRIDPKYAAAYNNRGNAWSDKGDLAKAVADYKQAISIDQDVDALCNLAWLLATCPDAEYRDGAAAVIHATKACQLTDWNDWDTVHRLAASYAEAGSFDEAVDWQKKALELAPPAKVEDLRSQLKLFSEGKPYRDDSLNSAEDQEG